MISFGNTLGTTSVSFLIYLMSTTAALGINAAFQDYASKHDASWKRWVWATGVCVVAILIITTIVATTTKPVQNTIQQRLSKPMSTAVSEQQMGRL